MPLRAERDSIGVEHAVGDLPVYFEAARSWLAGQTPYAEFRFEYPPYALLAFPPAALVSSSLPEFQVVFGVELLLVDVAIRAAPTAPVQQPP